MSRQPLDIPQTVDIDNCGRRQIFLVCYSVRNYGGRQQHSSAFINPPDDEKECPVVSESRVTFGRDPQAYRFVEKRRDFFGANG